MYELSSPLSLVKGIGDTTAEKFTRLGLSTVRDLLFHIPFRYEDYSNLTTIASLQPGEDGTILATARSVVKIRTRRGLTMIKAKLQDKSGSIDSIWFNQEYLLTTLRAAGEKYFSGTVKEYRNAHTLNSPTIEEVRSGEPLHSGRLVPIYEETEGLSSRTIRSLIHRILLDLPPIPETLPTTLLQTHTLPSLDETLRVLHFPKEEEGLSKYHRRLAFEEVFSLLKEARHRQFKLRTTPTIRHLSLTATQQEEFIQTLPFHLSPTQEKAIHDLSSDLTKPYPTNRLVQGEVGSGKTIIAAFGLYVASVNNAQSVFVAPTQILAHQHFQSLKRIFDSLHVPVYLVTSDSKPDTSSPNGVFIGTHALFEHVKTLQPALVVVDEEQRFGVRQRETFLAGKKKPHFVTMTATPIPRTIAQTVLADRDVSYLDEIPEKKKDILTKVVPQTKRVEAEQWMNQQVESHHSQVFIVCPFIHQSEIDTLADIKSAEQEFKRVQHVFPRRRIALLHGSIKKEQRVRVFDSMRQGDIDILVATPMIEVGIDIPNASIIVIEGAERFGLAQLHQLRGRVGRAGQRAYCFLFPTEGIQATRRLRILCTNANGNTLAEEDLRLRGTGELLGTRQHGWDSLRFASWFDTKLIEECKKAVAETENNPSLKQKQKMIQKRSR
ncbi:MAG TPA: ATP-dependent DNA helicase RecG [Patescibacteria group bacterium]|nr:ATP-dependent DNA helicase RecG [Patescibacteria group bacterium]